MNKTLSIVIKVVSDQAQKSFNSLTKKVKDLSNAASGLRSPFIDFNRIMFSTTAFLNTFGGVFAKVFNLMSEGAQFDRLESQFKRIFGKTAGSIPETLKGFTTTFIDQATFMRSAIKLRSQGIITDYSSIAQFIAKAGTAAKIHGFDAAEGVDRFSKFMQDGAVSHLSFLDVLAKTNPQLQAQLTLLKANTGQLGGVISTQAKLRIGLNILNSVVNGNMFGAKDLLDVTTNLGESFKRLKESIGNLVTKALFPYLEKLIELTDWTTKFFDGIKTNYPILTKFLGHILAITGAAIGLFTIIGTISFAFIALYKLLPILGNILLKFVGINALLFKLSSTVFLLNTGIISTSILLKTLIGTVSLFLIRFSIIGTILYGLYKVIPIIMGISQAVSSIFSSIDNLREGIAYLDDDLKKFLEDNKLLGWVISLSRSISNLLILLSNFWGKTWIDEKSFIPTPEHPTFESFKADKLLPKTPEEAERRSVYEQRGKIAIQESFEKHSTLGMTSANLLIQINENIKKANEQNINELKNSNLQLNNINENVRARELLQNTSRR